MNARVLSSPCSALLRLVGRLSRSPRTLAVVFLLLVAALAWTVRDSHHEASAIATRNCRQIEALKTEIRGIIHDGFNSRGKHYRHVHQREYDRARARFKPLKCPGDRDRGGD